MKQNDILKEIKKKIKILESNFKEIVKKRPC